MSRREFLMLGKPYDAAKMKIAGFYMSEKLDGIRAFWDGGLSRGLPTKDVPWANTINPKTGQMKTKIKPVATGLWSRYGNPIMAPDWFLNSLPACPLDGELWAGKGGFQTVTSVCKKDVPEDEPWKGIQYGVFGCPPIHAVFQDGEIKNSNFHKLIEFEKIQDWMSSDRIVGGYRYLVGKPAFSAELANVEEWIDHTASTYFMIKQTKLPMVEATAKALVEKEKRRIIEEGGEGLVLRNPSSIWQPKRVKDVIKVKGELDDEGTLVGFTSGRETNKGSKLLGMIGALILDYKGQRLELSGLTDEERRFATKEDVAHAIRNPGVDMPASAAGMYFVPGDKITFLYRELTKDGIPKEARYMRKRT